ncbi:hypothetical protein EMIT07CA2_550116 [Brevibacillus sp. IT-7CA2]
MNIKVGCPQCKEILEFNVENKGIFGWPKHCGLAMIQVEPIITVIDPKGEYKSF